MKKIKTYWWFWGLIPVLLLNGFLFEFKLDIPVHDTYFVVSSFHISILISLIFLISGAGYLYRKIANNPNHLLEILHFSTTFIGVVLILFPMYFVGQPGEPKTYESFKNPSFLDHIQDMNNIISLGLGLIILGIITYFINLGIAIFKNKT